MVYYEERPPDEDRGGCLDAWVITRGVFALLFWPFAVLGLIIIDLGVIAWLFTENPLLALVPVVLTVAAVAAFARWEQRRFRPPDL